MQSSPSSFTCTLALLKNNYAIVTIIIRLHFYTFADILCNHHHHHTFALLHFCRHTMQSSPSSYLCAFVLLQTYDLHHHHIPFLQTDNFCTSVCALSDTYYAIITIIIPLHFCIFADVQSSPSSHPFLADKWFFLKFVHFLRLIQSSPSSQLSCHHHTLEHECKVSFNFSTSKFLDHSTNGMTRKQKKMQHVFNLCQTTIGDVIPRGKASTFQILRCGWIS